MRSEHATPETMTRVSFRFSVGQKYYRIERNPEQEVAAKNGTVKRVKAKTAFYEKTGRICGLWVLKSRKLRRL